MFGALSALFSNASALNPSVSRPSGQRTTGRLMTLGSASIRAVALASSTTPAWVASSSRRQVVPARLTSLSRPKACSQAGSSSAGTPCFLKSWKTTSRPYPASQARAFLTVSQLGMP